MRSQTRRKWQVAGQIFALTLFVLLVLYFCAYAVLHVRYSQPGGRAMVEYSFAGEELPNPRLWRAVFRVANGIDRIVRPGEWKTHSD